MKKSGFGLLLFLAGVAAAVFTAPLPAQAAALFDKAAPLSISKWVKGGPVTIQPGQLYIIEFWATWCPPCRASIPHLTELAKQYKGKITFVGVSDEDLDVIQPFVEQMGVTMDYHVAQDAAQATERAYMGAYGINTIPHAFLVNQEGKVAWHGNPLEGLDDILADAVTGKITKDTVARKEKLEGLIDEYFTVAQNGDQNKAKADAIGRQILELGATNSSLLSRFAWTIVKLPGLGYRDGELAAEASKKAYELSKGREPMVAGIHGGILYQTGGNRAEAIAIEKKAISQETNPQKKAYMEGILAEMQTVPAQKDEATSATARR